mgnify:CR=1 FL=1
MAYCSTEGFADCLMTKANTENRNFPCKVFYYIYAYAGILRFPGPGEMIIFSGERFSIFSTVISSFLITPYIWIYFTYKLIEIVGKAVVIIN